VFYIRRKEVAEEIVSDVFVKCWECRKNLLHIVNPETYLFVAVKNQSLNYLKKYSNIHLVQIESSDQVEFVNTFNPEREMERKELHFLMDQAIASLPQQACIIFRLIKEDGMKYKEVAEILNISPRTVQTQLFRAMKKLSVLLSVHQMSGKSAIPFGSSQRSFKSFREAAAEASISRFYGGIHYMESIEKGNIQGKQIGNNILIKIKKAGILPQTN
jgi:RNA polymerase sigma-70 factor (ECF subfamily)